MATTSAVPDRQRQAEEELVRAQQAIVTPDPAIPDKHMRV
jgi:hypothetical protein